MAARTKKKSAKRDVRSTMTKASRGRRPVSKRPRRKPAKRRAATTGLPGWSDLAAKKSGAVRKAGREAKPSLVDGVPTFRFAVLLVAACTLFTLYVGHVYATQSLVSEVQQLRKDNGRLVLKRNRLAGEFDRRTSPSVILGRAEALGLEPSSAYAPTIHLQPLD
jgi:hypothetical protein